MQWCSSNHNDSAHDFVSKLPKILIRPSHCWPLRDLEYASTEQQGTLLIKSLELNMRENEPLPHCCSVVNLLKKRRQTF